MSVAPMDQLIGSLNAALEYPKNLVCHHSYQHVLESCSQRLKDRENNLFCNANKALVSFWQYDVQGQGMARENRSGYYKANCPAEFGEKPVRNIADLREQLRLGISPQRLDPKCRFM